MQKKIQHLPAIFMFIAKLQYGKLSNKILNINEII